MTSRSRLVAAVLAIVIATVGGAGIWAALDRRDGGDEGLDPSMAAVLADLEAFVESARGLRFSGPVDVAVLGDAAFRRAVSGGEPVDPFDTAVEAGVLRALGLIEPGERVGTSDELDADSVAGFYDTDTKELVVRGRRLTPFVRQVLVHELTHALDDQHFDLDPDLADDEAALAFDALVEGDATYVEQRYVDSLSEAERRQAEAEEAATFGGGPGDPGPAIFADLADFPYVDGPDLIAGLLSAGGQARLDDAFRFPPTTSAEVLHPQRFLAGRGRAPVPNVRADGRVVDDGVIGEFVLERVLAESSSDPQAKRAAEGWAGDRYVAWRAGKRTCVRTTVVLDSDTDAGELVVALRTWAGDHAGATVEPASPAVTFSRCA